MVAVSVSSLWCETEARLYVYFIFNRLWAHERLEDAEATSMRQHEEAPGRLCRISLRRGASLEEVPKSWRPICGRGCRGADAD